MSIKRVHPGRQIETDYSLTVGEFFSMINREYIKALRKAFAEKQRVNTRYNAIDFSLNQFLLEIRKKIQSSSVFLKMLDSIPGAFQKVENLIVKDLSNAFQKRGFPIPEMYLKADSESLAKSVQNNVELIKAITDKHSELLEKSVMEAVNSGSDFDIVIREVEAQADRGKAYAEFVARDQINKAYADISREKQTQSGVEKYEWVNTSRPFCGSGVSPCTRKSHAAHDGKIYSWNDPPLINFALDGQKRAPEYLHPGQDYQCYCIAIPVFD